VHTASDVNVGNETRSAQASPGRAIRDGSFEVDVISSADGLRSIAVEWRSLERLTNATAVFQSHAQLSIWARHFIPREGSHVRLHVAVVRRQGRPVLILPLVITGLPVFRVARMAGDPIAQYSEILLDPALADREAFAAALRSVKSAGADVLVVRRVRNDSPLLGLAPTHLKAPINRQVAPFANLSPFAGHTAFLESLPKKMRRGLTNRKNHLERAGDSRFEILFGGPEARAAVANAIDLKRKWLIQRGALSGAFADPATRNCLLDLAGSTGSGAVVHRLLINGEPAAFRFGFEHAAQHFSYMSAYDDQFANISPGRLLLNFCISSLWERGIEKFDMLAPAGGHKSEWCRDEVGVADYSIPLSASGRLYAELYQERIRPALARAWHGMPAPLRSLAAALLIQI